MASARRSRSATESASRPPGSGVVSSCQPSASGSMVYGSGLPFFGRGSAVLRQWFGERVQSWQAGMSPEPVQIRAPVPVAVGPWKS